MSKIKSLTLTNFGPFRGTHKISFSTDEKRNLTIVIGGYTFSFGPPSILGGSDTSFQFSTMISDGIRNALGKNVTKNWSEWFPEHYSMDPKSSVEIEGKAPVINEENDFLYFFKPERDYDEQESHHPLVVYGDHRLSLVSDPKIEKFVSQKVADEMNNISKKWKFFAENGIKFVFENKQIQVQNAEDKQVTFKHNPDIIKSVDYAVLSGSKMKTNFLEFIGFILFLALRRVHLPEDSFAVIEGGRGFSKLDTIPSFFSTFLRQCPQVIYLTETASVWEGQTYDEGLEDLKQSKKSISRVYRMTGKDIGKYGNYDGDNAEEMELSFGIDGMKFPLYMDYHATTPVDERVFEEMKPYFTENFGNASSIDHSFGYDASVAVQTARETISNAIGCKMDEIIFTSGATESDNLALIGVMEKNKEKGNHLITCKTEHKAILDCAKHLEENGCEVTYLSVNDKGEIDLNELESAITEKTVLVSLMAANNEIGTIANLEGIGKIAHEHDVLFHTDAAQAVGHIPIDVEKMNIDLMSFSSHKIYGPKGIGALYVRSMKPRVKLDSLLHGGGQERNIRSGTLNVPGIIGFAKAVEIAVEKMEEESTLHKKWTEMMLGEFEKLGGKLNGHPTNRLTHNLNVRFDGIESKAIINSVSKKIAISAGSACTTEEVEPSHVLLAIGLNEDQSHEAIRIGLGRFNTTEEVKLAIEEICDAVKELEAIRA